METANIPTCLFSSSTNTIDFNSFWRTLENQVVDEEMFGEDEMFVELYAHHKLSLYNRLECSWKGEQKKKLVIFECCSSRRRR